MSATKTFAAVTAALTLAGAAAAQYPAYYPNPIVGGQGPQVSGVNPHTGAIDTHSQSIHASTFAPGRAESMNNGTMRYVQRPITDAFGNVTGYERGWVWNNSMTGQEHGNLQQFTPNGLNVYNPGGMPGFPGGGHLNNSQHYAQGMPLNSGLNSNAKTVIGPNPAGPSTSMYPPNGMNQNFQSHFLPPGGMNQGQVFRSPPPPSGTNQNSSTYGGSRPRR